MWAPGCPRSYDRAGVDGGADDGRMTGPRGRRARLWAGVYVAMFGGGDGESDADRSGSNRNREQE